ncbi:MAG: hypothetical protein KDB80_03230, partial [Planctomycetes bacterium]|nr:hypothetical protein [Planctomycetota bacterium]
RLVDAWRRVGTKIERSVAHIRRPLFFTELGYASQEGINKDPWNYFIAVDDIDLGEQRDCFAAVLEVVPTLEFVHGAFWFDYFGEGGRGDSGYTPRGKPAIETWREWAAVECDRGIERSADR